MNQYSTIYCQKLTVKTRFDSINIYSSLIAEENSFRFYSTHKIKQKKVLKFVTSLTISTKKESISSVKQINNFLLPINLIIIKTNKLIILTSL